MIIDIDILNNYTNIIYFFQLILYKFKYKVFIETTILLCTKEIVNSDEQLTLCISIKVR